MGKICRFLRSVCIETYSTVTLVLPISSTTSAVV